VPLSPRLFLLWWGMMPKITLFFPQYFEDPAWAGSSFCLDAPSGDHGRGGEWVIGRLPTCDVTIAIQSVSRRHCSLAYSYAADRWAVTCLGGKNGTRLNGRFLEPGDPTPVRIGDKLHLGPNPIHIVENDQSTEEVDKVGASTIVGTKPLDYRTGEPLPPPPPEAAPSPPDLDLWDVLALVLTGPKDRSVWQWWLFLAVLGSVVVIVVEWIRSQ
jgi:hypothetical protein